MMKIKKNAVGNGRRVDFISWKNYVMEIQINSNGDCKLNEVVPQSQFPWNTKYDQSV